MFLCTCIKVVVTTLLKFSRQNSETFLLDFWKWGKKIGLPENFFVISSSEHVQRIFDEPAVTMPAKVLKIFFAQSLKMIAMRIFKKKFFSFTSLLQKIKKTSSGHAECDCDHRARKFPSKIWKPFVRIPELMKKLCPSPTKLFLPKTFV